MSAALEALQRRFMAEVEGCAPCAPGLEVYRRGVAANRHGALAAAYPVVRRLVGEAFFREAARAYASAHPSRSGDLGAYGERMAEFLRGYPHAAGLPYLGDVAALEWAVHCALHAAEAPLLDFAALARVEPASHGALRLALAPAVRLVQSAHPIHALWEANQPDRDGTPASSGAQRVIVWRQDGRVRIRPIDAAEWAFLGCLERGETLSRAHDAPGVAPGARLGEWLARYAAEGVVCGFGVAAPE